jgi:hypothetical protein
MRAGALVVSLMDSPALARRPTNSPMAAMKIVGNFLMKL